MLNIPPQSGQREILSPSPIEGGKISTLVRGIYDTFKSIVTTSVATSDKSVTTSADSSETKRDIEIHGKRFEVGPNLGKLSWGDMHNRLFELNKTLKQGEKPWRIFTKDEYEYLTEPMKTIARKEELSLAERRSQVIEYAIGLGFLAASEIGTGTGNSIYWSSTENINYITTDGFGSKSDSAFCWQTNAGHVHGYSKENRFYVLCVREA